MVRAAVLTVEFLLELSTLQDVLPTPVSNTQTEADVDRRSLLLNLINKEEQHVTTIGYITTVFV